MSTIVRATLPADQFALSETLRTAPTAEFEIVRMIAQRSDRFTPFLWATASDGSEFDALPDVIESDPSTESVELISELDGEYLVRAEWTEGIDLIRHVLVDEEATILDARGGREGWQFRVLFPEHACVSSTYEYCDDHDIDLALEQISQLSGAFRRGKFGLTKEQYEAIVGAYREGYYTVPRDVKLEELADRFDVSHQALSERLRRGHEKLIRSVVSPESDELSTNV